MSLSIEQSLRERGFSRIAGADEVGRGALAGPLFAAAVILPFDHGILGLKDSKLCTPDERERLSKEIKECAVALALVRVYPRVIDRRGLHKTNLSALRRALVRLDPKPDYALTDGFPVKRSPVPCLGVKKGDVVSPSIAAASIVAKVARDRAMVRLHRRFPQYGFRSNKGYGTAQHREALKTHGPSPVHRMSFWGIASGYYASFSVQVDAVDLVDADEEW
ncbi:MAG: ribonuclease HII [Actinobacteria bacterium]|nr:ribonuclease HII [Actinomycetota bacterium]